MPSDLAESFLVAAEAKLRIWKRLAFSAADGKLDPTHLCLAARDTRTQRGCQ
jgi:hypothetical protein